MARFPRSRRIHRSKEIRAIVTGGRRVEGSTLNIHLQAQAEPFAPARATVVVPRFGHTAVERNRLKRRLRELVRLHVLEAEALAGSALVVRARPGAYGRGFAALAEELLPLVQRAARGRGEAP